MIRKLDNVSIYLLSKLYSSFENNFQKCKMCSIINTDLTNKNHLIDK